jgi:hypothetical protein
MTTPFKPTRRHFLALAARLGGLAAGIGLSSARAGRGRGGGNGGGRGGGNGGGRGGQCLLRGTRISTHRGEIPVEEILPGDLVRTSSGSAAKVRWVGRQVHDLEGALAARSSRFPLDTVRPVRIARFALDDCTPKRDLFVSPGHALLLDGVLIPVFELINGVSIAPVEPGSLGVADYFHVLLETHEVIFAEGTPVETLLVGDARDFEGFLNGADYLDLWGPPTAPMKPFAPVLRYRGASAHISALARRACTPIADVRDPLQVVYDRIAERCGERAAA